MIALLVITDGRRDCITQTIPSALAMLEGPITSRVIYDDSGDPEHRAWLADTFPTFEIIWHPDGRQGFGGAIRTAWTHLATGPEPFIFHLEDDFTFNRPVKLKAMAGVLASNDTVIQLALRRQPWNQHERLAGGVVEQHPDDYTDVNLWDDTNRMAYGLEDPRLHPVLLHRLFFTTNPSLYRRSLCEQGWPTGSASEGVFTHQMLQADPAAVFGYWGARDSGEWVTHIGKERVGVGY